MIRVGATKQEIADLLDEYAEAGIENILYRAAILKGSRFTVTLAAAPGTDRWCRRMAALPLSALHTQKATLKRYSEADWRAGQKFDLGACAAIAQCIFECADYLIYVRLAMQRIPSANLARYFTHRRL